MIPDWLVVLLAVLAVPRLTRLVVEDVIFDQPRAWVQGKLPDDSMISYLISCAWCTSVWAGLAVAGIVVPLGDTWPVQVVVLALAASQVTGLLIPRTYPED